MGKTILPNPNLTKSELLAIFEEGFQGRYRVYASNLPAVDVAVRKSGLIGIALRLKQTAEGTQLTYNWLVPSPILRVLCGGGLLALLLFGGAMRRLEKEIGEFIETSPALRGDEAAPRTAAAVELASECPPRHGFAAVWLGVTAMLAPIVAGWFFGFVLFWFSSQLFFTGVLTAAAAFGLSKVLPGSGNSLFRGVFLALIATALGRLAMSLTTFGPAYEIEYLTAPIGLALLGIVAVSGAVMAKRTKRAEQPHAATASETASI